MVGRDHARLVGVGRRAVGVAGFGQAAAGVVLELRPDALTGGAVDVLGDAALLVGLVNLGGLIGARVYRPV
jgi:hypothetical protein